MIAQEKLVCVDEVRYGGLNTYREPDQKNFGPDVRRRAPEMPACAQRDLCELRPCWGYELLV